VDTGERNLGTDRLVATGGFVLVLALYLPYFFLPVMDYNGPILGLEGFIFCVVFPPMWPIVLGHVALWFGSICLLLRRWSPAWIAAIVALLVRFQSWRFMLEGGFPGQYMKLLSMIALLGTGLLGANWLRPSMRKPNQSPRTGAEKRADAAEAEVARLRAELDRVRTAKTGDGETGIQERPS
jgi:hypothetical protein